jgi:protein-tyrosine phosphatase
VTAESVEGQENALKSDVLREIEKHNGRLLLHDETDDGNGRFTLTAQWEDNVQADDILTPKEVYERMVQAGYRVNYARLPVTDEQAPIPRVFARLEERVADALQHADVAMAFNCQMGRGRTTTAMVAASLVATLLHPEDVSHNKIEVSPLSAVNDSTFEIREIEDPYLNGEYKIIFQLMSVLQYGKQAKCLADKAIDQSVHFSMSLGPF